MGIEEALAQYEHERWSEYNHEHYEAVNGLGINRVFYGGIKHGKRC